MARGDGSVVVFEYPRSAFPSAAVYGKPDYPSLPLVIWGGVFDAPTGSYQDTSSPTPT